MSSVSMHTSTGRSSIDAKISRDSQTAKGNVAQVGTIQLLETKDNAFCTLSCRTEFLLSKRQT
jgi:hypothetical protein